MAEYGIIYPNKLLVVVNNYLNIEVKVFSTSK